MTALIAVGLIHGEGFHTAPQTSPLASSVQTPEASESIGRLLERVRELETEVRNGDGAPKLLKHEPKNASELSTPCKSPTKPSAWRCACSPGRAPILPRLLRLPSLLTAHLWRSRKHPRNPLYPRPLRSRAGGSSPASSRPKPSYRPRPRSSRSESGRRRCCTCSRGWAGTTRCCCSGFGDGLRGAGVSSSTNLRICSHSARRAATT